MVTAARFTNTITTLEQLREFIPPPSAPALAKEIAFVDEHARAFIERSPFALIATAGRTGAATYRRRATCRGSCRCWTSTRW